MAKSCFLGSPSPKVGSSPSRTGLGLARIIRLLSMVLLTSLLLHEVKGLYRGSYRKGCPNDFWVNRISEPRAPCGMLDMERLLLGEHRNQWFPTWLHIRVS